MLNGRSPDVVRARVVAGGVEIPCCRAGRGEPVVLLADSPSLLSTLFEALAGGYRVVAPEPSPPAPESLAGLEDFPGWLRAFLDALGLEAVAVVAGPPFAAGVLDFALLDPERVTGVAFLQHRTGDESARSAREESFGRLSGEESPLATSIGIGGDDGVVRAISQILAFLAAVQARRNDWNASNPVVE